MAAIIAGLGGIFYSMLVKLIGYEFVTNSIVIGLRAWAASSKNHRDQEIVEAVAKAWGVTVSELPSVKE